MFTFYVPSISCDASQFQVLDLVKNDFSTVLINFHNCILALWLIM